MPLNQSIPAHIITGGYVAKPPSLDPTEIRRTRGRLICLVGQSGMGKSTLCSLFPNPYFLIDSKETGIVDLIESGDSSLDMSRVKFPGFNDWKQMIAFNAAIIRGEPVIPNDTLTIVYESITGLEELARDTCCREKYKSDYSANKDGYYFMYSGPKVTAFEYWSPFITQLSTIREMGYNVVLTGHSEVKMIKNPKGPDYLSELCKCANEVWDITHGFFENVFFLVFDVTSEKENKFARGKASKATTRSLYCFKTPYANAKNRCNIDEVIDATESPQQTMKNLCYAANWNIQTLRYLPQKGNR